MKYAYSSTATGASAGDWASLTIDADDYAGGCPSLTTIYGCPAVIYALESLPPFEYAPEEIRYAYATTSTGSSSSDWNVTLVDTFWYPGTYTTLTEVSGLTAASYYDYFHGCQGYAIYIQ